jgi:hypothetical protein
VIDLEREAPALRAPATEVEGIEDAEARAIVARAIERYIGGRHARVEAFAADNFSLLGSLRLHRRALGLDLLRAPANVTLVVPYLAMQLAALALRRLGARRASTWLRTRRLFFETDVARELTFRLHRDLLELPFDDGERQTEHDALAETILEDPRLQAASARLAAFARRHRDDPAAEARRRSLLASYASTRNAAADLFNNALLASAGATLFSKLTPGVLTLAPVVATVIAHQAAVASFPLGVWLGGVWYGWFPVSPSLSLTVASTATLILITAITAALAGVIADPIQRAAGWHQRRLHKLIDTFGRELQGDGEAAFHTRDHYVARIFDLIDLARATYRGI